MCRNAVLQGLSCVDFERFRLWSSWATCGWRGHAQLTIPKAATDSAVNAPANSGAEHSSTAAAGAVHAGHVVKADADSADSDDEHAVDASVDSVAPDSFRCRIMKTAFPVAAVYFVLRCCAALWSGSASAACASGSLTRAV